MPDVNFCPFCDSPRHKLNSIKEGFFFCRECNTFFKLNDVKLKCLKCSSTEIGDSEFPSPDGQLVFQCMKCKKMFSAKEFFSYNKVS